MALANVSDAEILAAVKQYGSVSSAAVALDVSRTSLRRRIDGILDPSAPAPAPAPKARKVALLITRESLHAALVPPNTCKVKVFLDTLDDESREVVKEALGYKSADLSSGALRTWLIGLGFKDVDVPSNGSISDHRNGRRPCRCSD